MWPTPQGRFVAECMRYTVEAYLQVTVIQLENFLHSMDAQLVQLFHCSMSYDDRCTIVVVRIAPQLMDPPMNTITLYQQAPGKTAPKKWKIKTSKFYGYFW